MRITNDAYFVYRDGGCQFRALYSYNMDTEEIDKLYGQGPKRITDGMFDKFFKLVILCAFC